MASALPSPLVPAAPAALLLVLSAGANGCVEARCTLDRECPAGEYCETATGVCLVPECVTHDACASGLVCDDHQCVPGCRGDAECGAEQRCLDLRCVDLDATCSCPLAPSFCGPDLNSRSATAGAERCVPDDGRPTVLVVGSVACSHCHALLSGVLGRVSALADPAPVVFVQLRDRPMDEAAVTTYFAPYAVPVIHDSDALDITGRYAADWYHVVLVDAHGCLVDHWGPLAGSDLEGPTGDALVAELTRALSGACPETSGAQ